METHKCPNCGASLGAESESYSTICPYCNSTLINKAHQPQTEEKPENTATPNFGTTISNNIPQVEFEIDKSRFSIFLFIILLIFFWPIAIVYLIGCRKSK